MNKFEMYIKKYGILLDCITLILCAALVAKSVLGTSTFLVTDSFINVEVIYKVLLVIAIIKLYFCFDIRDKKYIGAAVLLISLELDEVMSLSDRILVMYEGEIVGEFDPKKTTVQELGLYMVGAKRDTQKGGKA